MLPQLPRKPNATSGIKSSVLVMSEWMRMSGVTRIECPSQGICVQQRQIFNSRGMGLAQQRTNEGGSQRYKTRLPHAHKHAADHQERERCNRGMFESLTMISSMIPADQRGRVLVLGVATHPTKKN